MFVTGGGLDWREDNAFLLNSHSWFTIRFVVSLGHGMLQLAFMILNVPSVFG